MPALLFQFSWLLDRWHHQRSAGIFLKCYQNQAPDALLHLFPCICWILGGKICFMTAETVQQLPMVGIQNFLPNKTYSFIIQKGTCILTVKGPGSFSSPMQKDLGFVTHLGRDLMVVNAPTFARQPGGLEKLNSDPLFPNQVLSCTNTEIILCNSCKHLATGKQLPSNLFMRFISLLWFCQGNSSC